MVGGKQLRCEGPEARVQGPEKFATQYRSYFHWALAPSPWPLFQLHTSLYFRKLVP
jgi:hypothetical protein